MWTEGDSRLQMVATAFASPTNKEEADHRQGRLFSIVESNVVSKLEQ